MENSISSNFESTNSIDTLKFLWIAEFKGDTYIMQQEDGIEHRFKEVQDKIQDLKYFCLYNRDNMYYNRYTVDLEKGNIYFNNGCLLPDTEEQKIKKNIRLIFFRRHRIELNESNKENKHTIYYFLGLQYNDELGYNRRILLQIDEEDNIIFKN